jgi:hypothetical protein
LWSAVNTVMNFRVQEKGTISRPAEWPCVCGLRSWRPYSIRNWEGANCWLHQQARRCNIISSTVIEAGWLEASSRTVHKSKQPAERQPTVSTNEISSREAELWITSLSLNVRSWGSRKLTKAETEM